MRLFVALSISEDVREKLGTLVRELSAADPAPRWINPGNLHITLKFIGEVSPDRVTAICDALSEVRVNQSLNLEFRGLEFFPNARRPSVAWVGIESSPCLALLAGEINRTLVPLGIPSENKPFVPHLTIARFKQPRVSPALNAKIQEQSSRGFGFTSPSEFQLMESRLKSGGAEYTMLRSFPLLNEGRRGPHS